jgi:hypothetical protein
LGSFAGFVYFRATGRARYLVLSMVAFAGSLLSKEIATTLPLLLLLYDLFGRLSPIDGRPDASSGTKRQGWLAFLLRHGPFWAILGVYLVVRGAIFHSYLREGQWGIHPRDMLASGHSFRVQITGLAKTFVQLQEFALDQALLHFSAIPVALVLGIVLAWSLLLLRTGSSGRREMTAVLFFGLVWYGVTSLPLLITYHSARHFYLPAAGPCLAIACLGARAGGESFGRTSSVRWAAALALLGALAFLTWGQNRQWVRAGELSKQLEGEFAVAVENTPGDSLAIVWAPDSYRDAYVWAWILPFALQPPFTSSDLYSQRPLIEFPDMFCCPVSQWWAKKRPVLLSALVGDPDGEIQVQRLAWDDPNQRVRRQGHAMTRKSLRAAVESVLGKSVEDAQDIDYDAAQKLMRRFVELTEQ